MEHYLNLGIRAMFLENMALAFFLGMCSFLACSKKVDTAIGLGVAVVFVQVLTVPLNQIILKQLLAEVALHWVHPSLAAGSTVKPNTLPAPSSSREKATSSSTSA